jgi:hypothetical protein
MERGNMPISAILMNYLQPANKTDSFEDYRKQIKTAGINDLCRKIFTVNGESVSDNIGGHCSPSDVNILNQTFDALCVKLFNKEESQLDNMEKSDLDAVLILSSQSAFAYPIVDITTTLLQMFPISFEPHGQSTKVIKKEHGLSLTNEYHSTILKHIDDSHIPYVDIHIIVNAVIRPIPEISCTVEIIKKENIIPKVQRVLGTNNPTEKKNFLNFPNFPKIPFVKSGKYTKRERKSKRKSRVNRTRRSNVKRK